MLKKKGQRVVMHSLRKRHTNSDDPTVMDIHT